MMSEMDGFPRETSAEEYSHGQLLPALLHPFCLKPKKAGDKYQPLLTTLPIWMNDVTV
jgi:hypothetical protein